MTKKVTIISVFALLAISLVFYISAFKPKNSLICPFCEGKVINYQKYFEDENIIGLCSYKPLLKAHCLIIPKRHVERLEDITDLEMQEIFHLIKKTHFSVQKVLNE